MVSPPSDTRRCSVERAPAVVLLQDMLAKRMYVSKKELQGRLTMNVYKANTMYSTAGKIFQTAEDLLVLEVDVASKNKSKSQEPGADWTNHIRSLEDADLHGH